LKCLEKPLNERGPQGGEVPGGSETLETDEGKTKTLIAERKGAFSRTESLRDPGGGDEGSTTDGSGREEKTKNLGKEDSSRGKPNLVQIDGKKSRKKRELCRGEGPLTKVL